MADEKDTNTAADAKATPRRRASEPETQLVEPRPSAAERITAAREFAKEEREELSAEADIAAAPAENIDASGSIMEPDTKNEIDVDHPAVDNNPRAGTTVRQNRIDFNDPNLTSEQAVKQGLEGDRK